MPKEAICRGVFLNSGSPPRSELPSAIPGEFDPDNAFFGSFARMSPYPYESLLGFTGERQVQARRAAKIGLFGLKMGFFERFWLCSVMGSGTVVYLKDKSLVTTIFTITMRNHNHIFLRPRAPETAHI